MKYILRLTSLLLFLSFCAPTWAGGYDFSDVNDNLNLKRSMTFDYFHPKDLDFDLILKKKLPGDDSSVYLHLAKESSKSLTWIISNRRDGLSWTVIFGKAGVPVETIFVPVKRAPGPPYGKAWGYWKNKDKKHKSAIADRDFSDWISARVISKHTGIAVEVILDERASGKSLELIAGNGYRTKHGKSDSAPGKSQSKDKGNSGNKGKGKGKNK